MTSPRGAKAVLADRRASSKERAQQGKTKPPTSTRRGSSLRRLFGLSTGGSASSADEKQQKQSASNQPSPSASSTKNAKQMKSKPPTGASANAVGGGLFGAQKTALNRSVAAHQAAVSTAKKSAAQSSPRFLAGQAKQVKMEAVGAAASTAGTTTAAASATTTTSYLYNEHEMGASRGRTAPDHRAPADTSSAASDAVRKRNYPIGIGLPPRGPAAAAATEDEFGLLNMPKVSPIRLVSSPIRPLVSSPIRPFHEVVAPISQYPWESERASSPPAMVSPFETLAAPTSLAPDTAAAINVNFEAAEEPRVASPVASSITGHAIFAGGGVIAGSRSTVVACTYSDSLSKEYVQATSVVEPALSLSKPPVAPASQMDKSRNTEGDHDLVSSRPSVKEEEAAASRPSVSWSSKSLERPPAGPRPGDALKLQQPLTPRKCLPDAKQFSINLPSPRTHNLSGSFTPRGERRSARDQTTSGQNDASSVQRNPPPSSAICTPLLQQPSGIATPVLQTGLNLMKPGTPVLQTVGTPLMAFRPPLLNLAAASPGVAAGGTPLLGNRYLPVVVPASSSGLHGGSQLSARATASVLRHVVAAAPSEKAAGRVADDEVKTVSEGKSTEATGKGEVSKPSKTAGERAREEVERVVTKELYVPSSRKPTTKEQVEQVEQEQDQREAVDLDCRSESPVASPLPRPETGEGAHVVRTEPPTAMPPQEGGTPGLVTPNLDGADSATPQVSPSVPTVMKNDPRDFPDDDFFGGDRDSSPSVPTASDAVEDDVAAVAPVQNRNLPCEQAVETKEEHHPPHPSEDCAPEATHNDTETRECAAAILDGVIERVAEAVASERRSRSCSKSASDVFEHASPSKESNMEDAGEHFVSLIEEEYVDDDDAAPSAESESKEEASREAVVLPSRYPPASADDEPADDEASEVALLRKQGLVFRVGVSGEESSRSWMQQELQPRTQEEDASGTFSAGGDHDAQPEASRDDDTYSLDEGVESGDSAEIDELVLAASGTNENLPPSVSDAVAAETVDKDLDVALHLQNKEKEDKEPHQAPLTSPQGRPTTTSRMLGFLLGGGGRELPGEDVNGEHALPKDGGEEMKEYIRAAASPSDPLATPNSLCSGGNSQLLAEQDLLFNTCSGGAPSAGTSPMVVGGGGAGPGGSGAVFLQPVVAGVGGVVLASPVDEGRKIAADGLHAGGVPSSSSKKGLCLLTSPLQGENLLMDLTFESFAEELDGKTPSCGTSPAAVFEAGEKKPSAAGATGDGGRMEDEEPIAKFEDVLSDAVGVSSKAAEAQVDLQGSHGVACLLPERDELEPASGAPSPGSVPSPEVETICGDLNEERDPFLATGELVTQDRGNSILQRIVASQPASPELAGAQSNDQNVGQVVTVQGNSCGTASSPSDAEQAGVEPEQKRCTHKLLPAAPKLGWQLPPLAPKAWTSTRAGPGVGLLLPGGQQRQQSNGVAANNLLTPTVEQTSPKRKSQVGSNSGSSIMIPFAPTPRNSTNLVATPEQSGVNTSPNPSSPSPTRGMKHVGGPHLANNSITTAASTNKGSYRRSRPPAMPMLAPPSPVVTSARSLCLTPRCLTPLGPKLDLIRQQSGHLGQVASTPGMPHVQIKTKTEKNERSPLVETSH